MSHDFLHPPTPAVLAPEILGGLGEEQQLAWRLAADRRREGAGPTAGMRGERRFSSFRLGVRRGLLETDSKPPQATFSLPRPDGLYGARVPAAFSPLPRHLLNV